MPTLNVVNGNDSADVGMYCKGLNQDKLYFTRIELELWRAFQQLINFHYKQLQITLRHVTPDCYMCFGDIQRYFHSYLTAHDDRDYYCIEYGDSCWCYSKCCFGHKACPTYTSTFGAEYHHWFNEMGISNCMIVDDWLTAAPLLKQALAQMSKMSGIFESIGFTMQQDKFALSLDLLLV